MDLGGQGGTSFQFDRVGASVEGKIISLDEVQQTDLDSGEPAIWQDGRPEMMIKVVLSTSLRSWAGVQNPNPGEDDGERTVYLRGSRKPESRSSLAAVIGAALKATGTSSIDVGGWLRLTYVGDGEKTKAAFNAPKHYGAEYRAPSVDLVGSANCDDQAAGSSQAVEAVLIGWLNGKPITPTMISAMEAAGVEVTTLPGFVAA